MLGFWWRVVGFRFLAALGLLAVGLGTLLLQGDSSWIVGVLASVLVLGIAFVAALFLVHYRNSLHKLRAMGSPHATLGVSESSFSLSSGAGAAAFFVRGRMFFTVDNNHHGSGHLAVWCNAPPGAQESLVAADPRHFFVPPYVGKGGWLGVRLDSGLAWKTIADLLRQAHAMTGVKRKRSVL